MAGVGAPLGNDNPTRGKEWKAALRRSMAHKADGDYRATLLKIADAVVERALDGDKDAWREISEREDGKVPQALVGGDEDSLPIKQSLTVELIKPVG